MPVRASLGFLFSAYATSARNPWVVSSIDHNSFPGISSEKFWNYSRMFREISLEFLKQSLWDSSENSSASFPDFFLTSHFRNPLGNLSESPLGFLKKLLMYSPVYPSEIFGMFSGTLIRFCCGIFTEIRFGILPDFSSEFFRKSFWAYFDNLTAILPYIFENTFRMISEWFPASFIGKNSDFRKNPRGVSRKILEKSDNLKIISERVPEDESLNDIRKNTRTVFGRIPEVSLEESQ